jgi:serine/threonine protein kinase
VKLLPPDKAGRVALERFEREVQITASLSHPNTISVFDFGRTPDGIFYYAMEYLDGLNLAELVREDGPQGPGRVVHVPGQVASALVEAHGVGLIHRDIKPENVILCERGGVPDVAKVVDFGLVKDLEDASAALTHADAVQGTPLYLAPEARRPASAAALRDALLSLEVLPRWGEDEARAWWAGWRDERRPRRPETASSSSATLSVAFENRATPVRE